MARSRLLQHIDSLPALMADLIMPLARAVAAVVPASRCAQISRVFLTGCGDSHHAAVGAALAFRQFAHVSCIPLTALSCSRYHAPYLADSRRAGETDLLVAISVSGGVTRTIEALDLCRQAGAWTLAITGNDQTPLAQAGESVIETRVPPLPADTPEIVVPGMRSYVASQLALYLLAIQLGQGRGHLTKMAADSLRWEIAGMANNAAQTIANCDPREIARPLIDVFAKPQSAGRSGVLFRPEEGMQGKQAAEPELVHARSVLGTIWCTLCGKEHRVPVSLIQRLQTHAQPVKLVDEGLNWSGNPLEKPCRQQETDADAVATAAAAFSLEPKHRLGLFDEVGEFNCEIRLMGKRDPIARRLW